MNVSVRCTHCEQNTRDEGSFLGEGQGRLHGSSNDQVEPQSLGGLLNRAG